MAVKTSKNETTQLRGEAILIATGSRPHSPAEIPFDDEAIFDSDSILKMGRIPRSLVVVGGGVIGCEYASIFTALGVEVALVDGRDRVLPFLDAELSEALRERLAGLGVKFYLGERMGPIERTKQGVRIQMPSGKTIEMETALFAAGRRGAVDELQLEKAGLAVNKRGYVEVNASYQTAVPSDLRGGRRDRLSGAGFDLDGAGARGRVPRLRIPVQEAARRRCFRWASTRFRKFRPLANRKKAARKRASSTKWGARATPTTRAA